MKMRLFAWKFIFFSISILLIVMTALFSQSYQVGNYTEDDGLANSIVLEITQDDSGCMWFATRSGITVYDGSHWETHSNTKGLPVAVYSRIKCDSQGTIWALASYPELGIAYYQKKGGRWLVLPRPIPPHLGNIVTSFEVAAINNQPVVAVGTRGMGLYLWVENKWKNYRDFQRGFGSISTTINDMAAYDESFYIATDSGLYVLKDDKIDSSINEQIASPSAEVIGIAFDYKEKPVKIPGEKPVIWLLGKHWIGCLEKGGFRIVSPSITIPRNHFDVFSQPDNQGGLFYGNCYGIFHVEKESGLIRRFDKEHGLITGGATNTYLDREKNIWFGTNLGVSKLVSMRLANYRKSHGLLTDETTAVLEIKPGHMVLGHNDGLTYFTGNQFEHLVFSREEYKDDTFSRVLDILQDQDGNLWVAASSLGLVKVFNKKVIRRYGLKEGLIGQVSSVLVDKTGKIWVGTYGGIFILQGNRFIEVKPANDAEGIAVRRLFLGPGNSIYAATTTKGIYIFKNNEWKNVSHPTDEDANSTFAVLADSRGKVWVGSTGGLYTIDKNTLKKFKKEDFRINRSVYFILEDQQNRLWFGTDNGVIKWDGQVQKEYTVQQGLIGREVNRAAGLVDHQGRVWIGTDRGLSCYREEFEKRDIPPPIVELLSLDVSGEKMSMQVLNRLKYNMNNLVFNFRVVSFINEKGIRLQTRLEGFDRDWSSENVSNNRQVRYTNLSPGRYRFHLKARNSEGVWSQVVSSEDIVILKPFWQKRWFYVTIILILGFGFYCIQGYLSKKRYTSLLEKQVLEKTAELQKAHAELEKRVEDRTKELVRANKELQEQQNRLKTILKEKEVLLKEIHHRVKNNLQIIVSLLNLQSGYIKDNHALDVFKNSQERIRAMALVHEQLYESKDLAKIDFQEYIENLVTHLSGVYSSVLKKVHLKLEIVEVTFDIQTAIPLGLIINELISNSLKHAFPNNRQGELLISLGENKNEENEYDYTLIIRDNGVGFPADSEIEESNTLGILLVNSLVKQLHGSIELDRNEGTKFTLKFNKSIDKSY